MKYGKLTILEIKDVVNKKRRCVAKCDCGTIKEYQLDNINEKINNFMKYQEELFYTYFQ